MPLQNRVWPDGSIVAEPSRGTLMGNRGGRMHDPETRSLGGGRWTSRTWICCALRFKDRHRVVFGQGYTELFFCDEPTALAAGHRPCVECRRADAHAYRNAMVRALGLDGTPLFPEIDRRLHDERLEGRNKRLHHLAAETLPDGAMVQDDGGRLLAIKGGRALVWGPDGYERAQPRPSGIAQVLTPPTSLAALAAGFAPRWHPSAAAV
jgi:hypothetical protein